jgi:hypothetical protein
MEELKEQFSKEIVDFASKWFRKTAKDYITKYPEVILSMNEAKIAGLKRRLNDLVEDSERMTKAELNNPALWWHLDPHLHESVERYLQVADKYPEVLDRAVRRILGRLGVLLEEFGFRVTASGNTSTFYEFWFERPIGTHGATPCYPHLLLWTEAMQNIVRLYNAQYVPALRLYNEIRQLMEEKQRQEALTLWDSI